MTWSPACEVTSLFESDPYVRPFHLPGPGHGIQLQNWGGRLIVTVWHRLSYSLDLDRDQYQYGLSTLFSDDGGETWTNSEYMALENNLNEGRIAEMPNGDLVMNARSFDQHRYRVVSVDGGASWSDSTLWESIGQYGDCDSGFYSELKTGYTRLLTSHIASETTVRNSLWVYLSYDEGKTWVYGKELWNDSNLTRGTGASDITRISDGVYGIVHGTSWDGTQEVRFIRVRLSDLIGTEDETRVIHTHLGGTATCIQRAVCAICVVEYGEIDPDAHFYDNDCDDTCNGCGKVRNPIHSLEFIASRKATWTEPGHVAYFTCPLCQRIYADTEGKIERTKESVMIEPLGRQFMPGICIALAIFILFVCAVIIRSRFHNHLKRF